METTDIALETKGLTKRYGSFTALSSLDLEIKKGEIFGYLGPNGAGKTTTIRAILGLIKPTAGSATIFGLDSQKRKVEAHKYLAYVPGEASLWPSLTGAETLHLLATIHGKVDTAYQAELIKRFQFDPNKKVRAYSKGNRQKINLIAALSTRAELLVLDEPTSGLDPLMEQAFRESIMEAKANNQTVFLCHISLRRLRHCVIVSVFYVQANLSSSVRLRKCGICPHLLWRRFLKASLQRWRISKALAT